jgi:amino acid adenylation domain-containing protein
VPTAEVPAGPNPSGASDQARAAQPAPLSLAPMETSACRGDERDAASFPLSFAQQRLWFMDQLDPLSGAYNLPIALRLRGNLDVEALERSLNEIIRRHEALRTCFPARGGAPVQVIPNMSWLNVRELDLRDIPDELREAEMLRVCGEDAAVPFELASGPLIRARRLRLAAEEQVLLVTMHHIVSDAWSRNVLLGELAQLYDAFLHGRPSPLPELPIQYADFAAWEQEHMRGEALEEQLAYWRRQLADLPVLVLPTDRPRRPAQSFRGARHSIFFPPELSARLRDLARREGATLYETLLAGFFALLSRYTGQEDIVVGSPVGTRTQSETEGLIGLFVSMLVLRTDFSGDPTFCQLLQRVRAVAEEAYANQEVPFEKLVRELQPGRDLSLNPLFQVTFVSQSAPEGDVRFPGLTWSDLGMVSPRTRFDLEVHLFEKASRLGFTFVYATDLFDSETIESMAVHFRTLLEGILDNPGRRIRELPLISPAERYRMLEDWNQTSADYPRDSTVHRLFEKQARSTPDAEALVFRRRRMSYQALNERANRLARYLRRRGVGRNVLVGLCLERSLEMIVGLLAILKAGGAFLPLDPTYPTRRLRFMLDDTGARYVLTQQNLEKRLPDNASRRILIDSDWPRIARERADDISTETSSAGDLAYVMYTSGSTGNPKGVAIPHRGVVRLVRGASYAEFGAGEVFLQLAPVSFDASTFEIWGALLNGSRLVVMPPGTVSLGELGDTLKRHGVTTLWLTAGLFHQMVESQIDGLSEVRQLLAGGDTLSVPHVEKVLEKIPGCRLINAYGPTENTTFTSTHEVRRGERLEAGVPIGRPIANTRVYVLDSHHQPVPVGVPGELYVAGDGLAAGYWNRPALTAEKFVPDPFRGGGHRMYRTGDRVRYLRSGEIQFLGRLDGQVKVRGYRVELGEVEAALALHPGVAQAVVTVNRDRSREPRIVAHVAPLEGQCTTAANLRTFLEARLPSFMLPSTFVFMEAFPLARSGKVDRRRLPQPDVSRNELREAFVAPRTDTEGTLAAIWARLLAVESVGVHDNFFDLGGHSLLAVRLIAEIERDTGRRVGLATVFRSPTIAELAAGIENSGASGRAPSLVAIQPKGSLPPLFCVHANTGIVYYHGLARHLGAEQPLYALQSQGLDGRCGPYETIEEMAEHYIREIREVQPEGPYLLGGHSFGGKVAFEMARVLHTQGQRVSLLALFDTPSGPFRLAPAGIALLRDRALIHAQGVRRIPRAQRLSYLSQRARTAVHIATAAMADRYRLLRNPAERAQRRVLAANTRAIAHYVPAFYAGKITLFRATESCVAAAERDFGWGRHCGGGVEVHEIPGAHSSMLSDETSLRPLAERLADCLRRAQAGVSP